MEWRRHLDKATDDCASRSIPHHARGALSFNSQLVDHH